MRTGRKSKRAAESPGAELSRARYILDPESCQQTPRTNLSFA